jgi:putative endopeptidase
VRHQDHFIFFQYASGRVYADARFPNLESIAYFRSKVGRVIHEILAAFKGQIDQLDWMTAATKVGAYDKLDNMVVNVAVPDFLLDDEQLTYYYRDLTVSKNHTFEEMIDKLKRFRVRQNLFKLLQNKGVDRSDFEDSPAIVNAWYQVSTSHISAMTKNFEH